MVSTTQTRTVISNDFACEKDREKRYRQRERVCVCEIVCGRVQERGFMCEGRLRIIKEPTPSFFLWCCAKSMKERDRERDREVNGAWEDTYEGVYV